MEKRENAVSIAVIKWKKINFGILSVVLLEMDFLEGKFDV